MGILGPDFSTQNIYWKSKSQNRFKMDKIAFSSHALTKQCK